MTTGMHSKSKFAVLPSADVEVDVKLTSELLAARDKKVKAVIKESDSSSVKRRKSQK